jgi:chromosome partitioning protein
MTELGWPRQRAVSPGDRDDRAAAATGRVVSRETGQGAAAPPALGGVSRETPLRTAAAGSTESPDTADLPMAAPLRDELSAVVSRETEAADAARERVSRETGPGDVSAAHEPRPRADGRIPWARPQARRLITVANQKGGVGKTTSTVNLAAALAQHGARVLVIDLDPQGNASTAFGLDHRAGTPSIYEVLVDGKPIAEVAQTVEGFTGLDCVPATIDLAGAEIELVAVVAREGRLNKALAALQTPYDYVFVDCPPSLGLLTVNALVAAQEVLIPIQCEFYALEGLSQLLRNIDLVRAHLNERLHVSTILLTMYDGRTRLSDQVAQEVRAHFGDLVLSPTIPRSVRISEAPGYGQSVLTYDPGSRGAVAYIDAAREIAERSVVDGAGEGSGS